MDEIDAAIQRLGRNLPDIGGKLADRLKDANAVFAETMKGLKQLRQNQYADLGPAGRQTISAFEASRVGAERSRQQAPIVAALQDLLTLGHGDQTQALGDYLTGGKLAGSALKRLASNQLEQGNLAAAEKTVEQLAKLNSRGVDRLCQGDACAHRGRA